MVNIPCKPRCDVKMSVFILGVALSIAVLLFFLLGNNKEGEEQSPQNLTMISILFRHGEKNPIYFYPNDPYITYDWPGGLGALTQRGKLQAYNLGKNLRMRYYRFLPPNGIYTSQKIRVLSSAAERCIMTAQAVLAGFMPPLRHNYNLPIDWQPILIEILKSEEDILLGQKKPCYKYDKSLVELYRNPPEELRNFLNKNAELLKFLSQHTGKNMSMVVDAGMLYHTLKEESQLGLALPDWAENIFPDRLKEFVVRSYILFTETNLMKQVRGGVFLKEILENMEKKRSNHLTPDRNIFLYAGHDLNLVNVLNTLNMLDQAAVVSDYAAALSFELYNNTLLKDDFEVKIVYYFNSDVKFPKELRIPNCDAPCSLTAFSESVKTMLLNDYDEVCENPKLPDCKI